MSGGWGWGERVETGHFEVQNAIWIHYVQWRSSKINKMFNKFCKQNH